MEWGFIFLIWFINKSGGLYVSCISFKGPLLKSISRSSPKGDLKSAFTDLKPSRFDYRFEVSIFNFCFLFDFSFLNSAR